jgi:hypothetical protein
MYFIFLSSFLRSNLPVAHQEGPAVDTPAGCALLEYKTLDAEGPEWFYLTGKKIRPKDQTIFADDRGAWPGRKH